VGLSKRVLYDWVVVEYARAQIPKPWVACSDDGGRTFYHGPSGPGRSVPSPAWRTLGVGHSELARHWSQHSSALATPFEAPSTTMEPL